MLFSLICWDVGVPKPKNGPRVLEEGPQTPQQQQQHRTNTACVLSLSLHWAVVRVCVPTFEVAHANTVCVCVCLGVWSSVWVCVQGSKNYRLWRYVKAGVRGGGRLDGYTHLFKTHTHKHTHTTYAKCVCVRACMLSDHCGDCSSASLWLSKCHYCCSTTTHKNINF